MLPTSYSMFSLASVLKKNVLKLKFEFKKVDLHIFSPAFYQLIFLIFSFSGGLLGGAISSHLLAECIGHLTNLVSLTLQYLATNIMLYSIAETCTKLHILDISYSTEVTDLGLLYLCGSSGRCGLGLDR